MLKRKPASRPTKAIFVLICEGRQTEPAYFYGLRDEIGRNAAVKIEIKPLGKGAVSVVETALEQRKDPRLNRPQDKVWAVFDSDDVPSATLMSCRQRARTGNVEIAKSTPCFEIWLLWHFREHVSAIGKKELASKLGEHYPGYIKSVPYQKLKDGRSDALRRAQRMDDHHATAGSDGNPSSGVWRLVETSLMAARS